MDPLLLCFSFPFFIIPSVKEREKGKESKGTSQATGAKGKVSNLCPAIKSKAGRISSFATLPMKEDNPLNPPTALYYKRDID